MTATDAFSRRPLSRAFRAFIGPVLRGQRRVDFARSPARQRLTAPCALAPLRRAPYSAALGVAAMLEDLIPLSGKRVVTIICGGNVVPADFGRWVFQREDELDRRARP